MKRLVYIAFLILVFRAVCFGQSDQLISQWNRNLLMVNPAYTGKQDFLYMSLMHRSQWLGFEGAPTFQNFEAHSPLKKEDLALGLSFSNMKLGPRNTYELFVTYAYRIRMDKGHLSFGLKGGIINGKIADMNLTDVDDPAYSDNNASYIVPNFGFGVAYYNPKYFVGISIPKFLGVKTTQDGDYEIYHEFSNYLYQFTGGVKFNATRDIEIEPLALASYSTNQGIQFSILAKAMYKQAFIGGVGFRSSEAIIFQLGYNINRQFSALYNYDLNIGEVGPVSKGSHEIGVAYFFGYKVNASNPRDF